MSERTAYGRGEFCWVELVSPDVDAAATFYGDLLGWERERYDPDPKGYWYFRRDGKLVAGLETFRMQGQVPAWLGYVSVDDVTATAGKIGDAGGTVLVEPLDVPGEAGSMAVCQDAEGAVFALWQPGKLKGAQLVNQPGSWTWNNLLTHDVDAARDFYGRVFGWTAAQPQGAPDYIWNCQVDGQRWPEGLAGLMRHGYGYAARRTAALAGVPHGREHGRGGGEEQSRGRAPDLRTGRHPDREDGGGPRSAGGERLPARVALPPAALAPGAARTTAANST